MPPFNSNLGGLDGGKKRTTSLLIMANAGTVNGITAIKDHKGEIPCVAKNREKIKTLTRVRNEILTK